MRAAPGTLYSNSILPVTATDEVDEYGNTIWWNAGTKSKCIVVGPDQQLWGAEMAKTIRENAITAAAQELYEALRKAIVEADEWCHENSGCEQSPGLDAERALLARIET